MNVVGFDVAKDSLYAARIDRSGVVKEYWQLANTKLAIRPLLVSLRSKYKYLVVASEATGEYHRPLAESCLELGITFRLLNPLTVKQFVRATVRKRKTDLTDAEAIARVALQGQGTLLNEASLSLTKPVLRTAISLTQMSQMCNLMGQHILSLVPAEDSLNVTLAKCQRQLLEAASIYRTYASRHIAKDTRDLIVSIPGIADKLSTDILVEIGDISRFKGPKQLVAYAGLDPRILQSGKTLNRYGHLTKRGSKQLRRALFIAASVAKRYDPSFRAVYDKKRAEGKKYTEANIVVSRKLVRVIYSVLKNKKPYQSRVA
jgi:transposase